jgi:DNA polymerase III subunit delta'
MASLQLTEVVGQDRIKEVFGSAFVNQTMGHAYLLCGEAGTGKFATAFAVSMALLCEDTASCPCCRCSSCLKMLKYAHPDFHVIMPVVPEKEHRSDSKLTDEGWKYVGACVSERIKNPYHLRTFTGIPSIPLDWVKEVNHAIVRGATSSSRNVAILDGIDYMSKESANAMLKTLEEPPAGTVMFLLTDRLHAVLPTIISRCQILRFSYLSPELIQNALSKKYGIAATDSRILEVADCGSLGRAIYLYENPVEDITKDAAEFWKCCRGNDWMQVSDLIDRISRIDDYGMYEKFFIEMMHLIRNAFFSKFSNTENYIMGNKSLVIDLGNLFAPEQVDNLIEICDDALKQISSRAAIALVLVNFAISLMEMLNGEK